MRAMNIAPPTGLVVLTGPMFASKTTMLINHLHSFNRLGFESIAYKPSIDQRYAIGEIVSHDGRALECVSVSNLHDERVPKQPVIGVDEVQFFTGQSIQQLISWSRHSLVIASGLDLDFRAQPFEATSQLMAMADDVIKLKAICHVCSSDYASRTQRVVDGKPAVEGDTIAVGGNDLYEARCGKCFVQ